MGRAASCILSKSGGISDRGEEGWEVEVVILGKRLPSPHTAVAMALWFREPLIGKARAHEC